MLLNKLSKKIAVLGVAFGLVASPLAMAQQSSIELNGDSSADEVNKPQSESTSNSERYQVSPDDLTHDEGDSLDYSASGSPSDKDEGANPSPEDLTHDVGDSEDW